MYAHLQKQMINSYPLLKKKKTFIGSKLEKNNLNVFGICK